jgi:hypothetical protein
MKNPIRWLANLQTASVLEGYPHQPNRFRPFAGMSRTRYWYLYEAMRNLWVAKDVIHVASCKKRLRYLNNLFNTYKVR